MTYVLIMLLLLMMLFGAPLFAVILSAALMGFYSAKIDLSIIAIELLRMTETPLLLALPLFTFAGYILSESNASERLIKLTRVFFGWLPAGLAIVSLLACAVFTALTGASGVTIVALGALLLPALLKEGYDEKFSLGLVTSTGSLGLLLPPSIPLILYGIIVQQMNLGQSFTLTELFMAGLLPGLLMVVVLALWVAWITRHRVAEKTSFSWPQAFDAVCDAAWELPLPFFIFLGIFGGFFAVSEVAAVTALYVLIVECFLYKEINLKQLINVMSQSMQMVGGILLILAVSMAFTNYLVDAEVPMWLFEWVKENVDSRLTFLIVLNLFLLVLGAILDIFSALIIVVPLIVPVALGYGIHPIHLGIIFLANMQIGYLTPPVGMNLFIASYRFCRPITELYQATLPFILILLLCLLIITYVPWLSLWFLD
ncbi:MAG: TRAP transporter large permease subunit [Methylococcales symbiont of Iophon sp. n. MRB-2018]|nr:MAG: TRAP transporter large permease subunit [Methylococcales symbiont of Iophon sp. n. MRB-2018]KAF3978933.1 MAG: TRAP transporter large permease subunit [Methylococcales symbiont of Iophon sp. n. MRB-2018]